MKITIKSVLFGVIGRVIPRNLRVFTFEKREILRFGCIFEGLLSAKPCLFKHFCAKSTTVRHFLAPKGHFGPFWASGASWEPPGSLLWEPPGSLFLRTNHQASNHHASKPQRLKEGGPAAWGRSP